MSSTQTTDPLTAQLNRIRDGVSGLQGRVQDTVSPFHPDRVREARSHAVDALDAVTDAVDAATMAETDQRNAMATYQAAMRRHLDGDLKSEPKAPSPLKLEEARVRSVGRAGALLGVAKDTVREYERLESSPEVQEELRQNIRDAYRASKAPAREALTRALELVDQHRKVVGEASRAFHRAELLDMFGIAWRRDRHRQERTDAVDTMRQSLSTSGPLVQSGEWILMDDNALRDATPDDFLVPREVTP